MKYRAKKHLAMGLLLTIVSPLALHGMERIKKQSSTKRNSLAPEVVEGATVVGALVCHEVGSRISSALKTSLQYHLGAVEQQGKKRSTKKEMEDRMTVAENILPLIDFFGIYDGHGGPHVAEYVQKNLHKKIAEMLGNGISVQDALPKAFLSIDDEIKQGYLQEIKENRTQLNKKFNAGSTAAVAVIDKTKNQLHWAYVGDSRIAIVRKGKIFEATKDHKPADEQEYERIKKSGGFVHLGRVNSMLAVARSLGDFAYGYPAMSNQTYSDKVISAQPDVATFDLEDGDTIIIASDGLWGDISNEQVAEIVSNAKKENKSSQEMAHLLKDNVSSPFIFSATTEGAVPADDVSIIVVNIDGKKV